MPLTTWVILSIHSLPSEHCYFQEGTFPSSSSTMSSFLAHFKDLFLSLSLSFFFSFFFSFLAFLKHMEFPGQGSHLSHSDNLYHSWGNIGSLTHCAGPGIEPASWWWSPWTAVGTPLSFFLWLSWIELRTHSMVIMWRKLHPIYGPVGN